MSAESPDETKEKATTLAHVAKSLLPEAHLAPWMSILPKELCVALATMDTIAEVGEELERRTWIDAHPGEELPEDLQIITAEAKAWIVKNPDKRFWESAPEDVQRREEVAEEEESEFDPNETRGATSMIAYFNRSFARNVRDNMPSKDGIRARQAMSLGMAQKTGVAVEPQKRTWVEKLTGRGKEKEQVSGS